jgi:hypothetical protein
MTYKIKHENFLFIIICLISTTLTFGIIFLETVVELPFEIIFVFIGITVISAICYFLEQLIGTRIVFKDNCMIIYYFLWIRKIPLNEIYNSSIEQYRRYRRKPFPHYEYRMRMVINVLRGKDIKLTDDATQEKGLSKYFSLENNREPDEQVPLYQAYMQLKLGAGVNTTVSNF